MDIKLLAIFLAALMGAGIVLFSAVPASAADPEIPRHVTQDHLTELITLTDGFHPAYAQPDTSSKYVQGIADVLASNWVTYPDGKRTIGAQPASKPFTASGVEWRAVRKDPRDSSPGFFFILNSSVAEVVPAEGNPNAYMLAESARHGTTQTASASASASQSTKASADKAAAASSTTASSTESPGSQATPSGESAAPAPTAGQDKSQSFPPVLWLAVVVLALAVVAIVAIQMKKKGKH